MGEMIRRRTVFSLVTIVLFALRAWTMFYLMRLVNLGSYSVLTISFLLCAITAILFFGSPCFRSSWGRMVAIFQAVCDPLILFLLEGASCVWCVESTPIVPVGECSFFVGPVITVFFEQSPKVAFVIIGLIAHSFTSNRIE